MTVPPGEVVHEVGAALPLLHLRIREARADPTGELRIAFEEGPGIVVPINEHYESWNVVRPTGEILVGSPGGGVAHAPPS